MRSCSVRASRTCPQAGFYLDHDVTVAKGCVREYVEFETNAVELNLYTRRAPGADRRRLTGTGSDRTGS